MTNTTHTCGALVYEARCDLPYGHPGDQHHFEEALPPDINRMLGATMERYDDAAAAHWRARWQLRTATVVMMAATVLNAAVYLLNAMT